jgi:hypothetical protein
LWWWLTKVEWAILALALVTGVGSVVAVVTLLTG